VLDCRDGLGVTCQVVTTTGTLHPSTDPAKFVSWGCPAYAGYDITDPNDLAGRYVVTITHACPIQLDEATISCAVSIDPTTLPASCNRLVTPLVSAPAIPADGNADGDFCDAGVDGPFVEGQILGNSGVNQSRCQRKPSGPLADGMHRAELSKPPGYTRCSLFADFGFRPGLPACSDGADNDGDGAVDHPQDPGCRTAVSATESPQCQDGVDNDTLQDVLRQVDFDGGQSIHGACAQGRCPPGVSDPDRNGVADPDPDCARRAWRQEQLSCGLGVELAPILTGLRALRRRRRS
jgi:hypothetical protein